MHIDIISCVPELMKSPLGHSMLKRAQDKSLLSVDLHDLRDFGIGRYRQIDDYPYGGGAGMVMKIEPIAKCIRYLQEKHTYDDIIYLSPDGERLDQRLANELSLKKKLLLLAGHYKGVDQRVRDRFITREISIGDYVLSGGELPALVLIDALGRLLPGVLGNESSALFDSFQDNLLAPPIYTRPASFEGQEVPEVLLSGHQQRIDDWREEQSLQKTQQMRPDLLQENGE